MNKKPDLIIKNTKLLHQKIPFANLNGDSFDDYETQ